MWVLPLVFAACSLFSYRFPGDEYAMYFISSIAGAWIAFVFRFGDIHNPMIPVSVAFIGATVMALIGLLMDRIRIRKIIWSVLFLIVVPAIFVMSICAYPTAGKALRKNGSLWAYLFFAINMGLYCSLIFSFVCKGFEAVWKMNKNGNQL